MHLRITPDFNLMNTLMLRSYLVSKTLLGFGTLLVCLAGCSPPAPSAAARPLSVEETQQLISAQPHETLDARISAVLADGLHARRLSSADNAAWQIFHGLVCYGSELQIETPDRGLTSAVDYAFTGGPIQGLELMVGGEILPTTGRPGVKARLEPGSYIGQGHVDQWLAVCAMADLPLDTPIEIGQQRFTLLDWARQAQYDVTRNPLDEFSWTLIALTHYLPDEPTWTAADGSTVSWELLVAAELTYDIDESPCGGTHRLAGVMRALQAKERLGMPDSATWHQAQAMVDRCLLAAQENRNAAGGLSSNYFSRPGTTADLSAELASAGHLLEFIALAAKPEELRAPWVELSAHQLCELLEVSRDAELECGAFYHALHGLKILQERRRQVL